MTVAPLDHSGQIHSFPRERGLTEGFETLSDADLVAVLLGTGERGRTVNQLAVDVLERAGGLVGIAKTGAHLLASQRGVGAAKAARIGAAIELGLRVTSQRTTAVRVVIGSSQQVAAWARPRLQQLDHEQVWMLALDGRNGLRAALRIAEGGLHGCSLEPRDVLRAALRTAATGFILVHNHPSGDPKPSEEDVALTARVAQCGAAVGTPLLDHVIIGRCAYASLFDLGLLKLQ